MSKTPRTDDAASCGIYGELEEVSTGFARELETELGESKKELSELKSLMKDVESLIERKGYMSVSRTDGGGVDMYWGANIGGFPYAGGSSLIFALRSLVEHHRRIDSKQSNDMP